MENYFCDRRVLRIRATYTLPAKKWHWRARTSALYFAQTIPEDKDGGGTSALFCSSVLNLPELLALRPDLAAGWGSRKVVYFHVNQLVYPVRTSIHRDFQYGYNQILTALVADVVAFNSAFNRDSFLSSIRPFLRLQPDHRADPELIRRRIEAKSKVLHFPVVLLPGPSQPRPDCSTPRGPLRIVWPHRWEHDKCPEIFFKCLQRLRTDPNSKFLVSVLGESFTEVPEVFRQMEEELRSGGELLHFGRLDSKDEYFQVLRDSDVVVSTADHEFFGVAMIEAAACGCYPVAPNRLVYPEILGSVGAANSDHLYNTEEQLHKILRGLCRRPDLARLKWGQSQADAILSAFSPAALSGRYRDLFAELIS